MFFELTQLNCLILIPIFIAIGYCFAKHTCKTPLPFSSTVLVVVTVPETHAYVVREAMGAAGAGKVGNYSHCSFSFKGTGRFKPLDGAHPAIGQLPVLEQVAEEAIQMPCEVEKLEHVIAAIKRAHPYEEPGIDIMSVYRLK